MIEISWGEHAHPFRHNDEPASTSSLATVGARLERHPEPNLGTYVQIEGLEAEVPGKSTAVLRLRVLDVVPQDRHAPMRLMDARQG